MVDETGQLTRFVGRPEPDLRALTRGENVLLLAARPGDETVACRGFIAESCLRGRPPYLVVLADGASGAPEGTPPSDHAEAVALQTRHEMGRLGLSLDRIVMMGLLDGTVPAGGAFFEALVRAVVLIMWARDCNVILAPWADSPGADRQAAARMAVVIAAQSGIGHLRYAAPAWIGRSAASP